jgi:hypothetical protein
MSLIVEGLSLVLTMYFILKRHRNDFMVIFLPLLPQLSDFSAEHPDKEPDVDTALIT